MHYEYAVEPAAIAEDWKTCRYLAELFGFDRGRLLSQFPKKWLPMAIEATANLPPVEKKRVIEKLRHLKEHASMRAGRKYDPDDGMWLDNVVRAHRAAPFRAIVAKDAVSSVPEVIAADDVSETHRLFEVVRSISVPREAASITGAVAPLLSCARQVWLIDKYYDPFNAKYQYTLRDLLNHVRGAEIDFQIHYCEHGYCPDTAAIEREAAQKFGGLIPVGMKIKILRWRQKTGGLNFHARYLLTDRGGIGIDAGFSSEGGGERTDVHLLEGRFTLDKMTHFEPTATVFERVGAVLEIDENGGVRHV